MDENKTKEKIKEILQKTLQELDNISKEQKQVILKYLKKIEEIKIKNIKNKLNI